MSKKLLAELKAGSPFMPDCRDYANLLDYARIMTGNTLAVLRCEMGLASYKEWASFLKIA